MTTTGSTGSNWVPIQCCCQGPTSGRGGKTEYRASGSSREQRQQRQQDMQGERKARGQCRTRQRGRRRFATATRTSEHKQQRQHGGTSTHKKELGAPATSAATSARLTRKHVDRQWRSRFREKRTPFSAAKKKKTAGRERHKACRNLLPLDFDFFTGRCARLMIGRIRQNMAFDAHTLQAKLGLFFWATDRRTPLTYL